VISKTSISFTWKYCEPVKNVFSSIFDVFGVTVPKLGSETVGVFVAVIGNTKAIKVWTGIGKTKDCQALLFSLQCKSPRRDDRGIPPRRGRAPTGAGAMPAGADAIGTTI
jgi:hypothetical protein